MAKGGRPFEYYMNTEGPCWLFTGTLNKKGYGRYYDLRKHKTVAAHRYSYEKFKRPLLPEEHLHHRPECPKNCITPDHLTPTLESEHDDNITVIHKRKTHCPRGHAYDESNTYISKNGSRHCRTCTHTKRPSWGTLSNTTGREVGDIP